jgi:hypothetical protein
MTELRSAQGAPEEIFEATSAGRYEYSSRRLLSHRTLAALLAILPQRLRPLPGEAHLEH